MVELSNRLQTIASLVKTGSRIADIGTDHGYVPIYLIKNKIASKVIALDINQGPLEHARMHIIGHGLKTDASHFLTQTWVEVIPQVFIIYL